MRKLCAFLLFLEIVLLPARAGASFPQWWPGGSNSIQGTHYPDRVAVINLVNGDEWYHKHLREAVAEWNGCDSRLHLVLDPLVEAYSKGTITIFRDPPGGQEPAYGGWAGDHGIVALGGGWTRSREVIAHEMGHALGFGHAPPGADSIMYDSAHVTDKDCAGLRRYYGG